MTHPAEAERGVVHAGAGLPDVRDGDPRRRRARRPTSTSCAISELWSRFSEVAADNPNAWIRDAKTAEEIRTPSAEQPDGRAARTEVHELEQRRRHGRGGHHVLGRGGRAPRRRRGPLGVPALRHRLPRAPVRQPTAGRSPRRRRSSSAASRRSSSPASASTTSASSTCTRASRPPCSSARRASGCRLDRQLTRTGGLPFAGGPWNNYVMHAIATVVQRPARAARREGPGVGQRRLRHQARLRRLRHRAAGRAAFRHGYPQDEIDAMPRRELAEPATTPRARRRSRPTR